MKKMLFHFAGSLLLLTGCLSGVQHTKDGVIVETSSGLAKTVRLQVVTENVIRVTASPLSEITEGVNLIKDTKPCAVPPFSVGRNGDTVVLRTATTRACLLQTTGEVWFTHPDGALILREKSGGGKSFQPIEVEGTKGYTTRQVFEDVKDEALYGLGQHQSDEFNYKGANEELFQYNTKVSVPFIVSTKGYGVLWHNYSLSRFGDARPYANLNEVFDLCDAEGRGEGITASYTSQGRDGTAYHTTRTETAVDYEYLTTIRNLPEHFPRGNSSASWTGQITPHETGVHHFKLHYAGYVRVFIDAQEVVPERWRTAWNPNDYKFKLPMEKGKACSLRIEWRPDGNVSYLGLKALSPVAGEEQNRLAFWSEMGDNIDYYFIRGNTPDEVVGGYRAVTGKSQIMPRWAMGYWLSREHYRTQDEVTATLAEYRRQQVPLDVIVQDWNYWPRDAWGSHEFDSTRYPDPAAMVRKVHEEKARLMISVWPKFYVTTEHYKELDSIGAMYRQAVKDSIKDWIYPGYVGSFYDAYNPEARKLFWNQMNEHLYSLGIDAWWMDASEPNVQDNNDMDYRKKLCGPTFLGPSDKFFNAYALVNAEAIYDGQRSVDPNNRVFLLTRSGFAGQQRYSTATWSGDIATRWEDMKAQISAGMNFALSGIPYWTMDIGGFCVERRYERAQEGSEDMNEWRELNLRWYQFGAFCPLFRTHGQYPYREIYNISPEGSPTWQAMKYYNELRYRLMPYIYSLAGMTWLSDYTIMRALPMDYPADRLTHAVDDQYMFGPALMVCPVYTYKARSRSVYFPEGIWYDFYTGESMEGGIRRTVGAPYEHMPLFVRGGSIIPAGEVVQSTAEAQKDLTLHVYQGADASFTLYEDDGTTYDYEKGQYSTIPLHYNEDERKLTIGARQGDWPGMIPERNISVRFISAEKPEGETFNAVYKGESLVIQAYRPDSSALASAREILPFNEGWRFSLTADSASAIARQTDDQGWRLLDLPHDWSIEADFDRRNPAGTGGGALPGGAGWYRKHFSLSEADKDRKIFVEFDGIYCNSKVWINGHLLGFRPNGYVSFSYEMTPYLRFGADNLLVVLADNSQQPNSRWYSGSGIYRNVRLVKTAHIHVDTWGTYVTTPEVTENKALVRIQTSLRSHGRNAVVELATTFRDPSGQTVAQTVSPVSFRDGAGDAAITQEQIIHHPKLWDITAPNLYTAVTEVRENGTTLDRYETTFGIRSFRWDPQTGFYLNERPLKILGVCLHHDLGCLGSAVSTRAMERQLSIMKEMGANAIRTSHNPPAPELLDLCDRLGILVQDETFDMWRRRKSRFDYARYFDQWHRQDLSDHIRRDRNHPSVFMWSIGNEVLEQWTDATADTLTLDQANLLLNAGRSISSESREEGLSPQALITSILAGIVRELDTTRVVTAGNNHTDPSNHLFRSGALDVYGFNYHEAEFEPFLRNFPGGKLIVSESTSGLMSRGIYEMPSDSIFIRPERWDRPYQRELHICSAYDNCHVPWGSTHEASWREVRRLPHVAGMFVWTGFDYLGEPTPYGWPSRSSFFGIVDLAGFPKDIYYMYQSEWTGQPVLHLFPHWNWREGEDVDVWAYYNRADEVELYLNGRSLGKRAKNDTTLHVSWRVKFHPGVLRAVSRKEGKEVLAREIHTAGPPARIAMKPDRDVFSANGEDLSFVTVEIQDKDGHPVPDAAHLIRFRAEGPAFIAGTDNGNPNDSTGLKRPERRAFGGKALVVLQSRKAPGTIRLWATSGGLPEAFIEMKTE